MAAFSVSLLFLSLAVADAFQIAHVAPSAHAVRACSPLALVEAASDPAAVATAASNADPAVIGAAIALLGGGAVAFGNNEKGPKTAAPKSAAKAEAAPPPPAPSPKYAKAVGGAGAYHVKAGPWPRTPARKQWNPPKGWEPPRKPVTSWYDRGDRLEYTVPPQAAAVAAEEAAEEPKVEEAPKKKSNWLDDFMGGMNGKKTRKASTPPAPARKAWRPVGGSGAYHVKAGPVPKTPARKQWIPPPGWTPPSKPASPAEAWSDREAPTSWFDAGLRL